MKYRKFLALLMSVVLIFPITSVSYASDKETLENQKSEIQRRIDASQEKLDLLSGEKAETQEYLDALIEKTSLLQDNLNSLQSKKVALESEITQKNAEIDSLSQSIESVNRQIEEMQILFDEQFNSYCERLRAIYISGSVSNLEVLLTSDDISSMLTRQEMLRGISKQDSDALDTLMKSLDEINQLKSQLEEDMTALEESKGSLETDKADLEQSITEIESAEAELKSDTNSANALMQKLSSQSSEYMEMLETDKVLLQQIQNEISAAISSSGSNGSGEYKPPSSTQESTTSFSDDNNDGQETTTAPAHTSNSGLIYPTDSRTISAGFPTYSSGAWHGGIDFPVATGSNVYAAGSGTVILTKQLDYSYGYYILIDHGNGLSTLYAHNSQILVSQGQYVTQGQVIAKSGSTGNSTGPHCHFEVRVNGTQVNPLAYL